MRGTRSRWLQLALLLAVAWVGLASAISTADDPGEVRFRTPAATETPAAAPAAAPAADSATKVQAATTVLLAGPRLTTPAADPQPTLAPPRRNVLREAPSAKPSVEPPAAASVQGAAPKELPAKEPAKAGAAKPLEPVAEPPALAPDEIETASFNGVTPGVSTVEEVEKAWGKPKEVKKQDDLLVHVFRIEPFEQVEALFAKDKLASIVIRLAKPFPADGVARQLELASVTPVLISNDLGEILGQAYPERGVLFSFESSETPGKTSMKVASIVLEPVSAEPFLLRAETQLDSRVEASLKDLEQALKLAPNHARAHWLRARLLALQGDHAQANAAAAKAVELAPADSQFRLTHAQILGQLGRWAEAIRAAEKAVAESESRPHIKARGLCLLGDLHGSASPPDHKKAIDFHTQAVKAADALTSSPHPAIRLPAKETLIDAHLGAAHDIAWGNWNQKQTAVTAWLERASTFADDLVQNDGGTAEHRFRVAARALAACVGAQGKIDPGEWADRALRLGSQLEAATTDPSHKRQCRWELGLALYDAVQIYQMRNQPEQAVKYGQEAIDRLEREESGGGPDRFLLGRLYFRLGSAHALSEKDHAKAVVWFDKALPPLEAAAAEVSDVDRGRLGETLVSMAISYWESGRREKAVQLTQQGVGYLEQAVKAGGIPASALEIPQANLATMQRNLKPPIVAKRADHQAPTPRTKGAVER